MKCSIGISNFLEEMSSLSHSVDFLYFFAFVTWEGFLISPCYSLGLYIQMDLAFLFSFFLFLLLSLFFISQLFVRPHQTTILPFCISSSLNKSCSPSDRVEAPLLGPALDIKPLISFFFFFNRLWGCLFFCLKFGQAKALQASFNAAQHRAFYHFDSHNDVSFYRKQNKKEKKSHTSITPRLKIPFYHYTVFFPPIFGQRDVLIAILNENIFLSCCFT